VSNFPIGGTDRPIFRLMLMLDSFLIPVDW
jgi:hypothetical protein